jgi:hypothetical protein
MRRPGSLVGAGKTGRARRANAVADVAAETCEAGVDVSLRPLARALLALAEQLSREEEP